MLRRTSHDFRNALLSALDVLNQRRSVPSRQLGEPGPDAAELDALFAAAVRVPDHGKLVPFRLLTIRGEARARLGTALAGIHARNEPDAPPAALQKDRERYSFAPLIVAVIARLEADHPKVPEQEQLLSAGCVAYNLLLGAQALGYGAQWLTGWAAYDRDAAALLGLAPSERLVAFVHIGTSREPVPERNRPALAEIVGEWSA
ncbi:nitroreductase family protein [Dokdonella ginsengisoli]|uniref:Putative NAD(P)H nitroreductase n=1 Tax=Dokdonella ginsengisoli TaxID=363846 RepID=A0ABV9QQI4_9GAMM